jgi:hypothetical protein
VTKRLLINLSIAALCSLVMGFFMGWLLMQALISHIKKLVVCTE